MLNPYARHTCPKCAPGIRIKKYTKYGLRMHLRNIHKERVKIKA
jgi:hypothetical protein